MAKIDPIILKEIWNKGIKAGKEPPEIVSEAVKKFGCGRRTVYTRIKQLGLMRKADRVKNATIKAQNVVVQKVFADSLRLYRDGINLVDTAKKTLSRIEAIVALNQKEIEETKGKKISKRTVVQQKLMLLGIREMNDSLKTLMKYQEVLVTVHQYNQLKNAIIDAAESVGPEMKRVFLQKLYEQELKTAHLFGRTPEDPDNA